MIQLQVVKEFIDVFFYGLDSVDINLFGFVFTLWDVCVAASIATIIRIVVNKLFND